MNIGTLPFKNIDLKIHDMILFLMHRSGADFQALPSGSLAHQGQRFQSIQRAKSSIESRIHFGSVPALCTDIEAGKRKWKDHKLGLASSWGKGCQDVSPLFYSMPSGTKNKSPELNKEDPVGLFNPPSPPLRLP